MSGIKKLWLVGSITSLILTFIGLGYCPLRAETQDTGEEKKQWTLHYHFYGKSLAPGMICWTDNKGHVSFNVPEEGGSILAQGPLVVRGTNINETHGTLIIRGSAQHGQLRFVPENKIVLNLAGFSQSLDLFEGEEEIVLPLKEGARKTFTSNWVGGSGKVVWHLVENKQIWRVTVDGWDRFVKGEEPIALTRPKSLGKPSPWSYRTGKSATVKYNAAQYGVIVHWRMVIDVEIEKGSYKKGKGDVSIVSESPYCKPSSVYKCQAQKFNIVNAPFTVKKGVKSGQNLNLTVYYKGVKHNTSPVLLFVSFKCQLDKLAAEMTIAYWNTKKHSYASQEVSTGHKLYFPNLISVELIDNWSKSEGSQFEDSSRVYKVKKMS